MSLPITDYTKEEMKMYNEDTQNHALGRKGECNVCSGSGYAGPTSEAVWVETERPVSVEEARKAFASAEGVVLMDEPEKKVYPMPLPLAGVDAVYVGRIPSGSLRSERIDVLVCE